MRTIRRPVLWIALLLLLLILASVAVAADSPQQIIRHVVASAGQKVAAGPFILNGTLGEPIAGPFVTCGGFKTASGYWQRITLRAMLFLPMVRR